jgi:hypothetical protein
MYIHDTNKMSHLSSAVPVAAIGRGRHHPPPPPPPRMFVHGIWILIVHVLLLVFFTCGTAVNSFNIHVHRMTHSHDRIPPTWKILSKLLPLIKRQQPQPRLDFASNRNYPTTIGSTLSPSITLMRVEAPQYQRFSSILHAASSNKHHSGTHQSQREPHRTTRPSAHRPFVDITMRMSQNDNENNTNRDRYDIPEDNGDRNSSIVGIGAVAALLLLALSTLDALPSFFVIIATIVLFLILRNIASSLIFDSNVDSDVADENEIPDADEGLVPLSWQIDGTTLILSYFTATLLIPSDRIADGDSMWPSTAVPIVVPVLAIISIVAGCGVWFQYNIVRPTLEKEQELSSLSFTELLFYQWDQKLIQYLQEKQRPTKKTTKGK